MQGDRIGLSISGLYLSGRSSRGDPRPWEKHPEIVLPAVVERKGGPQSTSDEGSVG